MENFQLIIFIAIFFIASFLMFLRKLPALVALPLMAVSFALIGGVSVEDTLKYVIGQGSVKLSGAYTIAIFGSMLSVLVQKTGIAESFIKKGAELSGDNPWFIAIIMLILIISLFTTLGGLGAIIMVASIVLPIMASVGIGPMTTIGIFLIGLSIGGILNVSNWAIYISVMKLSIEDVRPFALLMFCLTFIMAIIYITIQLYNDGHDLKIKKIILYSISIVLILSGLWFGYSYLLNDNIKVSLGHSFSIIGIVLKYFILISILGMVLISFIRILSKKVKSNEVHWTAYFTPIIPLFLILIFDMDFIAAFICGLIYGFITTFKKGRFSLFIKCMLEGGGLVMPAVVLMFGIGMLLNAIMGPGIQLEQYQNGWPVLNIIKPMILSIVPESRLTYILLFSLTAPLALYRGPLNVWGMGYGLAAVLLSSGLNPAAVMGLLMSVGQIQGISDPTNTHNVWLANEMRTDVQKVLWNTIPYTWVIAIIGLIFSGILFIK